MGMSNRLGDAKQAQREPTKVLSGATIRDASAGPLQGRFSNGTSSSDTHSGGTPRFVC
jgi:hypothetical protein